MAVHIQRYIVAVGIFLGFLAPALPDTTTLSPRAVVFALSLGLIGFGTYLGAPPPKER